MVTTPTLVPFSGLLLAIIKIWVFRHWFHKCLQKIEFKLIISNSQGRSDIQIVIKPVSCQILTYSERSKVSRSISASAYRISWRLHFDAVGNWPIKKPTWYIFNVWSIFDIMRQSGLHRITKSCRTLQSQDDLGWHGLRRSQVSLSCVVRSSCSELYPMEAEGHCITSLGLAVALLPDCSHGKKLSHYFLRIYSRCVHFLKIVWYCIICYASLYLILQSTVICDLLRSRARPYPNMQVPFYYKTTENFLSVMDQTLLPQAEATKILHVGRLP